MAGMLGLAEEQVNSKPYRLLNSSGHSFPTLRQSVYKVLHLEDGWSATRKLSEPRVAL